MNVVIIALIKYIFAFFSADEWNLRKPMQECSLRIERRGDVLLIVFTFQKEGGKGSSLFALCKVDLVGAPHPMDHYVKPVADSSRYFAVRVTDENGGREAVIGLGFREREEAADFSQCLINYYNAIAREKLNRGAKMAQQ
jgi:adaptin ear-binding coat-associated protein 1/2